MRGAHVGHVSRFASREPAIGQSRSAYCSYVGTPLKRPGPGAWGGVLRSLHGQRTLLLALARGSIGDRAEPTKPRLPRAMRRVSGLQVNAGRVVWPPLPFTPMGAKRDAGGGRSRRNGPMPGPTRLPSEPGGTGAGVRCRCDAFDVIGTHATCCRVGRPFAGSSVGLIPQLDRGGPGTRALAYYAENPLTLPRRPGESSTRCSGGVRVS